MGVITCEVILYREACVIYYRERVKFYCSTAFCETLLCFACSSFDPTGNFMGVGRIGVNLQSLLNLRFRFREVPKVVEIEIGQCGVWLWSVRIEGKRSLRRRACFVQ